MGTALAIYLSYDDNIQLDCPTLHSAWPADRLLISFTYKQANKMDGSMVVYT